MLKLDYLVNHAHMLQTVAELAHAEFSYLNPSRTLTQRIDSMQSHLNLDALPITFVAFENDRLVGTASLREIDIESYTHVAPWLGNVMVTPEMRNKGIGSWLVQETMQQAFKLGIATWYLYTPNRESFYARLGWKTIDNTVYHSTPGVIMRLEKI